MTTFESCMNELRAQPKRWLVTGCAGFIGSNIIEYLLKNNQIVVGLDNFSTGYQHNLDDVAAIVGDAWENFHFIEGDIRDMDACNKACKGVDVVCHQAALGSVPRSIEDPQTSNAVNVDGFINMLIAARDAGVQRVVYASSSAVYGDSPTLPKQEEHIGNPLSPYAITKYANELYATVFASSYGMELIGLRYFNVFGPRQDPNGAYAAVIPHWVGHIRSEGQCYINGDGETSRDFCYIENVIQANILALTTKNSEAVGKAYNIAVGEQTTLNQLYGFIANGVKDIYASRGKSIEIRDIDYRSFREGDVRHSLASIDRVSSLLGYVPTHTIKQGMEKTLAWYFK